MTYYRIDNFHYELCAGTPDAKQFYNIRKANLKTTTILWICYGVEIDQLGADKLQFPILIWLN